LSIRVETSPFWSVASLACLMFLLALELVDKVRVRDELEVARQVQRDLLPRRAPEVPGWRFAHSYRTANEVGGDYYDFQPAAGGRLALVVGDASGHGMAAGLVMAIANATLRTALDIDPGCQQVLALLNRVICRTGDRRTFMSLFYGLLDPASGRLEYVGAGHPFPLLRRSAGRVVELGRGGLPLGLRDPLPVEPEALTLAPGDLLLLYSDGLPEAVNAGGQAFGFERLAQLLGEGGAPQEVHDRILAAFDAHLAGTPLKDDLTLVVVEREAKRAAAV
jgi:serine phosphatase RsbU (regulator of sigma subunit)